MSVSLPGVLRLGEYFSGPGGMSLGAVTAAVPGVLDGEAPIKHRWAVELDKDSCDTYWRNIGSRQRYRYGGKHERSWSVINSPVNYINPRALGDVDLFLFGFPCNDYSQVGEQKGIHGKYGPLYAYGVELISAKNPVAFVAENVNGLLNENNRATFQGMLRELADAGRGYRVTAHLYKFQEYGLPQTRHRVILVGIRDDVGATFMPPMPTGEVITAREAVENPRIPASQPNNPELPFWNNEPFTFSEDIRRRLELIQPGENVWEAQERLGENYPADLFIKGTKISNIYKRLDPSQPAYTVTAKGGGGTYGYHWDEPRPLTNRERARLQGFPDSFVFEGNQQSVRSQIGMAVPPTAARKIFEALIKTLHGISYAHTEPNAGCVRPKDGKFLPLLPLEASIESAAVKPARKKRVAKKSEEAPAEECQVTLFEPTQTEIDLGLQYSELEAA